MSRAVARTSGEFDGDLHDAARRAARREGLSLPEWLETVVADRATSLGLQPDDLDHAERVKAMEDRLRSTAPDTTDKFVKPSLSGIRPAVRARSVAADDRSDLRQAEAKLTALFRALDSAPDGRAETAYSERPPSTAILERPAAPRRSLADAIAEITTRQATLDRAPDAASRPTRSSPSIPRRGADSLDRLAPTRPRPALRRAAEPDSVLPAMTSLQNEMAALTRSLGDLAPKDSVASLEMAVRDLSAKVTTPDAPSLKRIQDQTAEMRDLLAAAASRARPTEGVEQQVAQLGARVGKLAEAPAQVEGMRSLERRVDALASKLDTAQVGSGVLKSLVDRVEHVRTSLEARLDTPQPAVDLAPLEALMNGLIGRVDSLRQDSGDIRSLEEMVNCLAAKLDAAREPSADAAVFADLQAQMGKLAQRIDRSDAGLTAIVSVERSLGELFAQMEETREAAISAAEGAARTAARDTLRAAMQETSLGAPRAPADAADDGLRQELSELRSAREDADRRLATMLSTVNETLEQVVARLVRLDASRFAADPAPSHPAEPRRDANDMTRPPVAWSSPDDLRPELSPEVMDLADEVDFPLEPGLGAAPFHAPRAEGAAPDIRADPSQFIAAARRAAQAAAREQAGRTSAASAARARGPAPATATAGSSLLGRARARAAAHRRPLLLSLASLVLLLGTAQVARLSFGGPSPASTDEATAPRADLAQIARPADLPGQSAELSTPSVAADAVVPAPPTAAPPALPPALPTLAGGMPLAKPAADAGPGLGDGLRDQASAGNAAAQYEVAVRLADGRGVGRDPKGAATWFEKAARQGLAPAAYRLGSLYEKGLGVAKDAGRAVDWYAKAADAGNVRAMHNLAVLSADGGGGRSDYAKAAQWFSKASLMGVRDSQFNLGILYARGLGIEQSLVESYKWFALAAAQGDEDAAKKRDEVGARLDPKALAAAKTAADDFKPLTPLKAANDVAPPPGGWDALPSGRPAASSANSSPINARVSSM